MSNLETLIDETGPFAAGGDEITLADLTLYPTFLYFTYFLPKVFKWPDVFAEKPKLRRWFRHMRPLPMCQRLEDELLPYIQKKPVADIIAETRDDRYQWVY